MRSGILFDRHQIRAVSLQSTPGSRQRSIFDRVRVSLAAVTLLSGVVAAQAASPVTAGPDARARIASSYGKLPLRFEANRGQAGAQVRFLSRGRGYSLFLTAQEAVLTLSKEQADTQAASVLHMTLNGALPAVAGPAGEQPLPGTANYLLGNDPSRWQTSVPAFGRVRYSGVYPGVDLVYYGNQRHLEFDFNVAPGVDPRVIQFHFAGARKLQLEANGDLAVSVADKSIVFEKPLIYQLVNGRRQMVRGRFALLADKSAGFALGPYDRSRPLVIDPVLNYSTYFGNSSYGIAAIAVDSTGAAYLTGQATYADFPVTPGAFETSYVERTAFVTKLNSSGTALIYSTYLGGSDAYYGDAGQSIAVDSAGEAYVAGFTYASNFPVTASAYQSTNKAAANSAYTGFLTRLNAADTGLLYSTYLGGSMSDNVTSLKLALDVPGDVYLAGIAHSSDFPTTTGALQTANKSAASEGWNDFIAKLNPGAAGKAGLVYSTYLGGSGENTPPEGSTIQITPDKSGDVYISGPAASTDFPVTAGAYQSTNKGAATGGGSNLTLSKLNPTATKLLYSTYLGGSGAGYRGDIVNGLEIDASGNAYLAGTTYESNFPVTTSAFQKTNKDAPSGLSTCFIAKMNPTGTALVYSTYLGGSGFYTGDAANGLAIDSAGDAYVTGTTASWDFPVTANAYQSTNRAEPYDQSNAFLTELNPAGSALTYSTYFGGSGPDSATTIALSGANVYLAGATDSLDFPLSQDPYQSALTSQSGASGFVAQFIMGSAPAASQTETALVTNADPAVSGMNLVFTAGVAPVTGTGIPTGNVVFSVDEKVAATVPLGSTGAAAFSLSNLTYGLHYILASYAGSSTYSASGSGITETIAPATPVIAPPGGTYQSAQLVSISEATSGAAIYYTTDGSAPTLSSTRYGAPILVSEQQTIRAISGASGMPASAIATASYTLLNAPTALAVASSGVSASGATLNALVNTYGMAGTYQFQYGTSSGALTLTTAPVALGGSVLGGRLGFTPIPVSSQPTNLAANTIYYYRVVVTTAAGRTYGKVLSFTTN